MTTQKQIKEWIPEAIATFQSIMPPISVPYPEFQVASAATLYKVRSALVEKTQTPNVNMKTPYTSIMETLHGDGGTAILVYQKYCPESQDGFNHALWHELGHFYAISTETESFFNLAGQGLDDNRIRQTGYWVWNEFVAECISNYICGKVYPVDIDKIKQQAYWQEPHNRLQFIIQSAYNMYPHSFSEYDLAFYFATLLTNASTVAYVDCARKNELIMWNPNKFAYLPMTPGSIDPTALSLIPEKYTKLIQDVIKLLQSKVDEEEFWKVDGEFLDQLGLLITELNVMKAWS